MWPFSKRPRSGSTTESVDAELQQQIISLRASLEACRDFGQRWRREFFLATGIAVAALGPLLFISWNSIEPSIVGLLQEVGLTEPKNRVDAAYQAYQNGDSGTSLRLARPFAEQGNARAQTLMGLNYYNGRGIPRNEQEAVRWFRLAAQQGEMVAEFQLGMMYAAGRGVPQSFSDAAKWIRLSADAGNPEAQFNMGALYHEGKGVAQSNLYAHMWFNLAASRFPASDQDKRAQAVKAREEVAAKMTADEISKAQELARDWNPKAGNNSS